MRPTEQFFQGMVDERSAGDPDDLAAGENPGGILRPEISLPGPLFEHPEVSHPFAQPGNKGEMAHHRHILAFPFFQKDLGGIFSHARPVVDLDERVDRRHPDRCFHGVIGKGVLGQFQSGLLRQTADLPHPLFMRVAFVPEGGGQAAPPADHGCPVGPGQNFLYGVILSPKGIDQFSQDSHFYRSPASIGQALE